MAEATQTVSRDLSIRMARSSDLDRLVQIEEISFSGDRLSRRAFARQIRNPRSSVLVADVGGEMAGYAIILFRSNSSAARLYSLAVDPRCRGAAIGRLLLREAECTAAGRGATRLRLEVRVDNEAARALYISAGFRPIEDLPGYYADGGAGIRYEKILARGRGETATA